MMRRSVFTALIALGLVACGTSPGSAERDASTLPDSTTADTGGTTGDARSEPAPVDSATDSTTDSTMGAEAGSDTGMADSAGGEAAADAGEGGAGSEAGGAESGADAASMEAGGDAPEDSTPADAGADTAPADTGPVDAPQIFAIAPTGVQTITVQAGQTTPTVAFVATLNGVMVSAGWNVDRGDIATVTLAPAATGIVAPTGTTGGLVTVTAGYNGMTASAQVFVKLVASQNGVNPSIPSEVAQTATSVAQLTAGGGVGGVGGEGLGPPVTDPNALGGLQMPSSNGSAQGLSFLYPYDQTVWPRGILAPLLMWTWSIGNADAIQIQLVTTSGSFTWTGTFGAPAILMQTGGKFIRQPIPQDVWAMATNTAGGTTPTGQPDNLIVSLTVVRAGIGYGPISETWPVAPGLLDGIIYYNSYGTQLAQNYSGAVGGNGLFGGAVLSIHVGDTAPQLVAGSNGNTPQCRTCHSVAAGGSRLIAQHGDDYNATSAYDLTLNGSVETPLTTGTNGYFSALYPDGSLALNSAGQILPLPNDSVLPTVNGLSTFASDLGVPMFSPDGLLVAFNPSSGLQVTSPMQQLYVIGFDVGTTTFSKPVLVVDDTGKSADTRPGWPAFLPGNASLVFHHQSQAGSDGANDDLRTRKGALAQIAWTSATDASHVTPLDQLNGVGAGGQSYLPHLAQPINMTCTGDGVQVGGLSPDHSNDVDVNYEPTVNPVGAGGYVWVVFTSRRMYGNEAVIPPFCSDPRGVDLVKNITTKKLWVAAIDQGAAPGTDHSHPAFYLPAQELLAGNSRGFWVLEPCRADGTGCQSGDQCCNGYCEAEGDAGALICANAPPNNMCSGQADRCTATADCCTPNVCVGGFCIQPGH
jgi:hypothetical protein